MVVIVLMVVVLIVVKIMVVDVVKIMVTLVVMILIVVEILNIKKSINYYTNLFIRNKYILMFYTFVLLQPLYEVGSYKLSIYCFKLVEPVVFTFDTRAS